MTDERDFREWIDANRPGGKYVTFRDYLSGVVRAGKARSEEFQALVSLFGLSVLEKVLEGKTLIEAKDFLKGETK
jgi:hypothetical protein